VERLHLAQLRAKELFEAVLPAFGGLLLPEGLVDAVQFNDDVRG
jgi:hypothetical protein